MYTNEYLNIMINFQLIEGHMKEGIKIRHRQLSMLAKVHGQFKYEPNYKWLDKFTMGPLAKKFSEYCSDESLLKRIEASIPTRNLFAHNLIQPIDIESLTSLHDRPIHVLRADLSNLMDREFYPYR